MIAVLPVIDPARCVTDPARFCRLAELRRLEHGLLNIWSELLYLTCPHEADFLTLIMPHKLTQYL